MINEYADFETQTLENTTPFYHMRCPSCAVWGVLDEEQFCGKTPIVCNCGGFSDVTDFRKVFNV